MAYRARVLALLAALFSGTAMRCAAEEPPLPHPAPAEFAATSDGDSYSFGSTSAAPSFNGPEADDKSDLPASPMQANVTSSDAEAVVAPSTAGPSIAASCDLPAPWLVSQPVHRASFYAAFEAVSLAREIEEDRVFATLNTPTDDVLNVNDLGFHQQGGIRVVIGAKLTEVCSLEMTAIGLSDWKEAATVSDASLNPGGTAGNLFSPFTGFGSPPAEGLDFNDAASIRLISALDTLEWNLRQRLAVSDASFGATALYGFRYLSFDELLEYRTHSTLPLPAGSTTALDVAMDNHLYGLQLGAAVDYRVGPYSLNLEGKAALCHNAITEEAATSIISRADPVNAPIDFVREENSTAFVGHLSATLEYRFSDHCVGRAGYQVFFVDGLALASQSSPAELLHDTSAIFHGPLAGLVVAW